MVAEGIELTILTADDPGIAAEMASKQGFDLGIIHTVDSGLWTTWDIQNPSKPALPQPTTYIVDPAGILLWFKTTGKYSDRIDAKKVIERIEEHRGGPMAGGADDAPEAIDWNDVVTVEHIVEEDRPVLQVTVKHGFHVYGLKERKARPMEVWADGAQVAADIPRKRLVEGRFAFHLGTPADEGELRFQACTDAICGPPMSASWAR